MTTPLLKTPEIAEGVANQATIHNQALRQMEAILVRVLSKDVAAPPAAVEGDSYIIPSGATGAWSGKTNQIAAYVGGGWSYVAPFEGQHLRVNDLSAPYYFDGAAWVADGGDPTAAIAAHVAASDPHPTYLTQTEGDARYAPLSQPLVVVPFYPGVPTASALMCLFPAPAGITTLTFAAALAGSSGKALVAATAQTDFDVRKNATSAATGTSVGTMRFAAAATVPTFIAASGFTLTGGTDWLTLWAPATPDATLANISGALYCARS
jgi:hypothetical protein